MFALPQKYLPEIVDAMGKGTLVASAYDQDDRIKLAEGHLELIDNQIDQGTGSIRLKAIFQNLDGRLGRSIRQHPRPAQPPPRTGRAGIRAAVRS